MKKNCRILYNSNALKSQKYKFFRTKIINEIAKCQICGSPNLLQVHHKDYNPLNNNYDNVLIVCQKCHQSKCHKKRRRLNPYRWGKSKEFKKYKNF